MGKKKYTIEDLKKFAESKGGRCLSEEYLGIHNKHLWSDSKDRKWEASWNSLKKGSWSPYESVDRQKKYTIEKLKMFAESKGGKCLSSEYVKYDSKYLWEDSEGRVWESSWRRIREGKWSPVEANESRFKHTMKDLREFAKGKGGECISREFSGTKSVYTWKSRKGNIFNLSWGDVLYKGFWCPEEGKQSNKDKHIKYTLEDLKKFAESKGGRCLSEEYTDYSSKYLWEDSKGRTWETTWKTILQNKWSPYEKTSKPQMEIYEYIKSIYDGEVIYNDRKALDGLELDVYIPERNCGIEFDGLYWHCTKMSPDAKKKNKEKTKRVAEKGINLLAIFEDEWAKPKKKELLKAMIRHRLNIKPQTVLRASKLELRRMKKNIEYKEFFEEFHLDGHTNASFAYGLFHGEVMVACMSFRKSFSDKCWEICRLASNYGYKIHGAAGKMINEYKREVGESLVTFSNNRLSLGGVYRTLGFKEITKTTDPSYYYTEGTVRIWRYKCRRINDPEIIAKYPTETAQAEGGVFSRKYLGNEKPLFKFYDYGHRKWRLEV